METDEQEGGGAGDASVDPNQVFVVSAERVFSWLVVR